MVFGIFLGRERAFVCFAAQFFNPLAQLCVGTPVDNPLGNLRRETAVDGV